MLSVLLCAAVSLQSGMRESEPVGPFIVEGVAFTSTFDKPPRRYLQASLRLRGSLPKNQVWTLMILKAYDQDGKLTPADETISGWWDVVGNGAQSTPGFPLQDKGALKSLSLYCQLVRYGSEDDEASFPPVKVEMMGSDPHRTHPAMRMWKVSEKHLVHTTSRRGLELALSNLSGFGYSGPGWDDWAILPVVVDPKTLNRGLEQTHSAEERVDATDEGGTSRTIYMAEFPKQSWSFSFMDKRFSPTPQLNLKLKRMFALERHEFTLTLPVQLTSAGHEPQWPVERKPAVP